jgi:multidrug efflux pump
MVPYDTSTFVDISIREVVKTLIEAMILVVLVMYLFLENARATFIPTVVVPVSLFGAMIGLYLLGYSINVLTLFAMVLAIAIVVDDAIVVIENVERIMSEEGLSPRDATRKAMGQIINAIIAITVVLTAVFVPLLFFGGSVGAIYRQFAVTLILTMGFSAFMALTLTPALCATLLKHEAGKDDLLPTTGFFGWFNRFFAATVRRYIGATRRMLGRPGRWLLVYGAILAATGWFFVKLPGSFLPSEDQGYFLSIIQLPSGATGERTLEVLQTVEQHYLAQKEVAHVIGVVGFSFFGRGQNAAITFVRLKSWDERPNKENSAESLVQRANMTFFRIKQAMIFAINVPPIPELAAVGGFDFRLQDRGGLGREKLLEARNIALGMASQNPNLVGVRPEGQEAGPQVLLDVNRIKARALGIDLGDLNETLQATLGTAYINDFVREGRILRVQMQAESDTRRTPEDLLRLPVKNARGDMIPLAEIATAKWIVGSPKLDRYNGLPSMKIAGSPAPGRSTGEALLAMEEVAKKLPPGVGFEWSGTSFEERLSGYPGTLPLRRFAGRGFPLPRRALRELVDSLCRDAGGAARHLRRRSRRQPARLAQRRVFQGRPDRHHRAFGEERDPDHRVRPRAAGTGQGPDRSHARSLSPALPAHPDDLDRLHVRRPAAGRFDRCRRQQPPRDRYRRDRRHVHRDTAGGLPGAGIFRGGTPLLPRPRPPPRGEARCVNSFPSRSRWRSPAAHSRPSISDPRRRCLRPGRSMRGQPGSTWPRTGAAPSLIPGCRN